MNRLFIHILMLIALSGMQFHVFIPHEHHYAHEIHIEDTEVIQSEHHDSNMHHMGHDFRCLIVKKTNTKVVIGFSKELLSYQNSFKDKNSVIKFRQFSLDNSPDITPIHLYRTLPLRAPPAILS